MFPEWTQDQCLGARTPASLKEGRTSLSQQ